MATGPTPEADRAGVGRAEQGAPVAFVDWMRGLPGRAWSRLGSLDPRVLIVFLITLVLAVGEYHYDILGGYDRLGAALGASLLTELVFSKLVRGSFANPLSAYITGISVALLIKPQTDLLWPFLLASFLSIASKYALQYRGRHLWNPSNFGISLLVLLAADNVAILSQQWGNSLVVNAVIWGFGLLIVSRVGMLHVTLSYVASFLGLAGLRSAVVGTPLLAEIAPLTGPMYQLFVFFMVTDPKTTVGTRKGRILVVVAVALVEGLIRFAGDFGVGGIRPLYYSPPILALFIVGPVGMLVHLHRTRKAKAASAP